MHHLPRLWLLIFVSVSMQQTLEGLEDNNGTELDKSRPENVTTPTKPESNYPFYISSSVKSLHDELYRNVINAILEDGLYFNSPDARARPPFEFKTPEDVWKILNFTISYKRTDHATLLEIVKSVIKYSSHASHPYKVDRHGSGLDPYALVGDWLGATMGAPVVTYALAPCYTLMEYEVQRKIRYLIYGNETGDGMIVPGTAIGNGFAIQIALQKKFPTLKQLGFVEAGSPKPALFYSEHAFLSHEKYCIWEGIGLDGCIQVETSSDGRMNLTDLVFKIKRAQIMGQIPFLVIATAGTPILGAIDPLSQISEVAKEYGMWFHVDGHLASATIISEKHRNRLVGMETSDSLLWRADKGLGAPYTTTILVTREVGVLNATFGFGAALLFAPSPLYNNLLVDNGDKTMQTTRRPDIMKLWFQWKAKGQEKLAQHTDYTLDMTRQAVEEIKGRKKTFELVLPEFESAQVAFVYIPPVFQRLGQNFSRLVKYQLMKVAKVAEQIKAQLLQKGIMTISVNSVPRKEGSFFVMSLSNSAVTLPDVKYMLDQIENEGQAIKILKSLTDEGGRSILQSRDFRSDNDFIEALQAVTLIKSLETDKKTIDTPFRNISIPPPPSSFPEFVSAPIFDLHGKFIIDYFETILSTATYFETARGTEPPQYFVTPEKLRTLFDFSLDNNNTGTMKDNEVELLETLKGIIKYSGHLAHPYYNFNLAPALDPYVLMAEYVASTLNTPMITFENSPMLTIMEEEVLQAVRRLVGYANADEGAGLILPGGSISNEIALLLAYMKKHPETKNGGVRAANKTLVAFVSIAAHYSTNKGSFFKGIGLDNCVYVEMCEKGKMSIPKLREAVEKAKREGKEPFLVVATTGTTVLGSYDPVDEIADICQEYNMWLHIDGSYGGSTLFTGNKTRKAERFKCIERADSFQFNNHKGLGSTRDATVFVTKHSGVLEKVFPLSDQEFNNDYLYDAKKYDPGAKQLLVDRRANIFKIWFLWKAKGLEGLGMHIDHGYNMTANTYEEVLRRNDSFELVGPHKRFGPECLNVNFYYVPKRLRQMDRKSVEFLKQVAPVQVEIYASVLRNNKLVLSAEGVADIPASLVLSLYNSALTMDDVKYMLDVIDEYGKDL